MNVLALAVQSGKKEDETIIWAIDLQTKLLIKAHVLSRELCSYSVGDCLELSISNSCRRQEIWVKKIKKIITNQKMDLKECLEAKASTPYSVHSPLYWGNIVKIEQVLEVNKNIMVANLFGFPNENKYLEIHDYKWNLFMSYGIADEGEQIQIVKALNSIKEKYLIIDFPENSHQGYIQVAAMVVI